MIPEMIETQLALPNSFLDNLARTASFRYKEYTIPKKTGGQRTIYHPARELKLVQKWAAEQFSDQTTCPSRCYCLHAQC